MQWQLTVSVKNCWRQLHFSCLQDPWLDPEVAAVQIKVAIFVYESFIQITSSWNLLGVKMLPQESNQKKNITLRYTEHFYLSLALNVWYIFSFKCRNTCIYLNTRRPKFPILCHKSFIYILYQYINCTSVVYFASSNSFSDSWSSISKQIVNKQILLLISQYFQLNLLRISFVKINSQNMYQN